ncbi:unnamed protein product [Angiostrongylus costaricensis]|uniref:Phosphorylase b kinase regulatory subunit n=1 Tax=Angiostrongylus costaricensis TaxID=334426 RepID=A0A0R3Q2C6_ANGCS|nr:unnamed protein product [Angiostrongylus costaricensis]
MFRGTFYSAVIVGIEWMASLRLRQTDDFLPYPSRLRDQICIEESEASVRALWAQIVGLVLSGSFQMATFNVNEGKEEKMSAPLEVVFTKSLMKCLEKAFRFDV